MVQVFQSSSSQAHLSSTCTDDGVSSSNRNYYSQLYENRRNPNGCPVSFTYFVSHAYTNYRMVQELYHEGHEIATHTISHENDPDFVKEIPQQRQLLNKFANIPSNEMIGFRAPFLEPGGDVMMRSLAHNGYTHDSTLLVNTPDPIYPFTLEFPRDVPCLIEACPKDNSYPRMWELPIQSWVHPYDQDQTYGMADEFKPSTKQEVADFLRINFLRYYNTNRAPFGIFIHASWFDRFPFAFVALMEFLDNIQRNDDVWMLNQKQTIEWMRNPTKATQTGRLTGWACTRDIPGPLPCSEADEQECAYRREDDSFISMRTCNACPPEYPWVDNPFGESD